MEVDGAWSVTEREDTKWWITLDQAKARMDSPRRLRSLDNHEDGGDWGTAATHGYPQQDSVIWGDTQWVITDDQAANQVHGERLRRLDNHEDGAHPKAEGGDEHYPKDSASGYRPFFGVHYRSVDGGDVLTSTNLVQICKFEKVLVQSDAFKEYCKRDQPSVDACWGHALTPLRIFYGDAANGFSLAGYDWSCAALDSNAITAKK